jgi:hypothetical protein
MVDNGAGLDAGPTLTTGEGGVSIVPAEGSVDVDVGPTCTGIACNIDLCVGNPLGAKATQITGRVFDPAGYNPIYNAVVYVPNAPLTAFVEGATCDACVAGSGSPIVTATTDATGAFTLQGVPNGTNVPLVIQIGKWRRKYIVPTVTKCVTNALPTANATQPQRDTLPTRLPRTNHEFSLDDHIPQMAIATGSADPFECLLSKMGIASSEFTAPTAVPAGRVHYYRSNGVNLSTGAPAASTLWSSTATMNKYDIIFLPCEGQEIDKGSAAYSNAISYANGGGRLFTTHYSYVWMQLAPSPFNTVATWNHRHAFETSSRRGSSTSAPRPGRPRRPSTNHVGIRRQSTLASRLCGWVQPAMHRRARRAIGSFRIGETTARPRRAVFHPMVVRSPRTINVARASAPSVTSRDTAREMRAAQRDFPAQSHRTRRAASGALVTTMAVSKSASMRR